MAHLLYRRIKPLINRVLPVVRLKFPSRGGEHEARISRASETSPIGLLFTAVGRPKIGSGDHGVHFGLLEWLAAASVLH